MGGSGAGKSTLLNIISGRLKSSKNVKVSGDIKINGEDIVWNKFRNVFGFVM